MKSLEEKNQKAYNDDALTHSKLGLDSTMFLAYRDLQFILKEHLIYGNPKSVYKVLDFGCGAGTSTMIVFNTLKNLNVDCEIYGIDVNENNLLLAQKLLPQGKFISVKKGEFPKELNDFDLIICNFVLLENSYADMLPILQSIEHLLNPSGIATITNCTSKCYDRNNKWYTFDANYDENTPTSYDPIKHKYKLEDGHRVKVTVSDKSTGASFSFSDFFHPGKIYKAAYKQTGLKLLATRKPVGYTTDKLAWKTEMQKSPYRIDIVRKQNTTKDEALQTTSTLQVFYV